MNPIRRRPLAPRLLAFVPPSGDPVALTTDAPSDLAVAPEALRNALDARVRAARGPLGAAGAHSFGLILQHAPEGVQLFATVLRPDAAMTEMRAALPLAPTPTPAGSRVVGLLAQVPATAVGLDLVLADGRKVPVPWAALAVLPDGSDVAVVDVARLCGCPLRAFVARHKTHLILGAAVAVGLGAWALSSGPRDNPSCGPSCGCAPCRARSNPSRARGTRRAKRAARRSR